MSTPARAAVPILIAILCASCANVAGGGGGDAGKMAPEHELAEKQQAFLVADLQGRCDVADAEAEATTAEAELALAEARLAEFEQKMTLRLDQVAIERDDIAYRAEEAKAELAELTAMYEADEFAKSGKELVLQRGRRQLELAERRLQAKRREIEMLRGVDLPREREELRAKLVAARAAHEKAVRAVELTRAKAEQAKIKATAELAAAKKANP